MCDDLLKLDMSMACQRLKSPQSLSGTSTHPTMVTHRSWPWPWMIYSHPFCSMSISPPIPQIRLFQTLALKLQDQGHECGQRARPYSLAQTVLTWEANVTVAVTVEMNWKHKVTPDWGDLIKNYNMVCSALFLQRALYTVHCTNIMHSRKPSFVITPAVFN